MQLVGTPEARAKHHVDMLACVVKVCAKTIRDAILDAVHMTDDFAIISESRIRHEDVSDWLVAVIRRLFLLLRWRNLELYMISLS